MLTLYYKIKLKINAKTSERGYINVGKYYKLLWVFRIAPRVSNAEIEGYEKCWKQQSMSESIGIDIKWVKKGWDNKILFIRLKA